MWSEVVSTLFVLLVAFQMVPEFANAEQTKCYMKDFGNPVQKSEDCANSLCITAECPGFGFAKGCSPISMSLETACDKLSDACMNVGGDGSFCNFCQGDYCNEIKSEEDDKSE